MIALSIRLSINPGQTQLTRTLVPVHSHDAVLVRPITAVARAVDGDVRRPDQARDRRGVDDAASVVLEHYRQHVLHA